MNSYYKCTKAFISKSHCLGPNNSFYCKQFPAVRVFPKDVCPERNKEADEFESQMFPTNFTYIFRFNVTRPIVEWYSAAARLPTIHDQ